MPTEIELPLIEHIIARAELERDPLAPLFEWCEEFANYFTAKQTKRNERKD